MDYVYQGYSDFFQACTGIDDVEVAILQLEESNWNLTDAVNKAIPAEPTVPERPPIVPGVLGVPAGATTSSSTSTPGINLSKLV